MAGILYGIGVGPGDPELLTIKAARVIASCDVIAAPGEDARKSVAYQIAVQAVPELAKKCCVGFPAPMTRDVAARKQAHQQAANLLSGYLDEGCRVGVLNLGDVTVYASFLYLYRLIRERGYEAELINGVPSFCAAAARLGMGLVEDEEQLHVLSEPEQVPEGLALPGTKVIMKMGKHLGTVSQQLREGDFEVAMVERLGMSGERIFRDAGEIDGDAGYYSLMIVKDKKTDETYE
ncbi:MAG: precorrin-2 C(20)-methyltransferase [Clostridiales bacterium]|nr:precorrin-2 C(20)-methyltransferase [Clostridiales bacterium]